MNAAVQPETLPAMPASTPAPAAVKKSPVRQAREREELVGLISQFSWTDYLLALPITLLALFALGILLIDFMLPREMKWANAFTAFIGVMFSIAGVIKIQLWMHSVNVHGAAGFMNTMLVDRFRHLFFLLVPGGHRGCDSDVQPLHGN